MATIEKNIAGVTNPRTPRGVRLDALPMRSVIQVPYSF